MNNLLEISKTDYFKSYKSVCNFVYSACSSYDQLWKLINVCQDHISGKKPISPEELKKQGMSWVSNFNFGKARAKIEKGVAESGSRISSAFSLGYASFRSFKEDDREDEILSFLEDPQRASMVSMSIGLSLYKTLSNEPRLSSWINDIEYPSYSFGYSALLFDKNDWIPEPVHPKNIAFRPRTKPSKIPSFVTFRTMTALELYQKFIDCYNEEVQEVIEDQTDGPQKISSSGWNKDALEQIILKSCSLKTEDGNRHEQWGTIMPIFQGDQAFVIQNTDDVRIAKVFHREADGSLTEIYIPWNNEWQDPSGAITLSEGNTTNMILFKKNHGKIKQEEVIVIVRDSGFTETGYLEDYRGLAKYAVEESIRYNRTRNSMNNKMLFVGSPMFIQPTTQSADKFKILVSPGGFNMIPEAYNLIEKQPVFDIASHINVLRFEDGEFLRDTQQYDATIQGRLSNRPNRQEVLQVSQEIQLANSSKNNIKLRDYAVVFHSILKRMGSVVCDETDEGYYGRKRFYDLMINSLSWMTKVENGKIVKLINNEADVNKILGVLDYFVLEPLISDVETITIAMQMAETPFARNRFRRMLLLAKGMPIEEVNNAVPLMVDKFINLQDDRIATIENDMFFSTNEALVLGIDDDIAHLNVHFAKAQRVIQAVQEGAIDPVNAYKWSQNFMAHCIVHIENLGNDPILNGQAQEYMAQFSQFQTAFSELESIAQQQIQAQQEAAGQVPIDPATEAEIARKNLETQSKIERTNILQAERTRQREISIQNNHEQSLRKIELDAQVKAMKP